MRRRSSRLGICSLVISIGWSHSCSCRLFEFLWWTMESWRNSTHFSQGSNWYFQMRKPTRSRLQSQTGLEASFETGPATKSKPPSARSAAFPGSSFGLRLFRVLLPAFTFHGTHTFWFCSHSLLCPRHESSLDYSEGLTKLHTSLHSSISMLIFSFSI